jgi:hypothetical protein
VLALRQCLDQRAPGERDDAIERRRIIRDRLGAVEIEAAAEDAQAAEDRLFGRIEQIVAPSDRRLQRLLPCGQIGLRAPEEPEAVVEPRRDLLDRQQRRAGGGELERERQTVEAAAEPGDRGRGGGVEAEAGVRLPRPGDEERGRLRPRHLRQIVARRQRQGRDRPNRFAGQAKLLAAGDKQMEARAGREQG